MSTSTLTDDERVAHEDTVGHVAVAWCGFGRGGDVHSDWCVSRADAIRRATASLRQRLATAEAAAQAMAVTADSANSDVRYWKADAAALRERLERACRLAEGLGELLHDEHCPSHGPKFDECHDEDAGCGETRETIKNLRAHPTPIPTEPDGASEAKGQP